MAKKITIEEYKKIQREEKRKSKRKISILSKIFIVLFIISVIVNIGLAFFIYELKDDLYYKELAIENRDDTIEELNKEQERNHKKMLALDSNVVVVIKGSNEYYKYDCMIKKYGENLDSSLYNIYTIGDVKILGFKEGVC